MTYIYIPFAKEHQAPPAPTMDELAREHKKAGGSLADFDFQAAAAIAAKSETPLDQMVEGDVEAIPVALKARVVQLHTGLRAESLEQLEEAYEALPDEVKQIVEAKIAEKTPVVCQAGTDSEAMLANIGPDDTLYIVAHGSAGQKAISSTREDYPGVTESLTPEALINQLREAGMATSPGKIKINACGSGASLPSLGEAPLDNFAADFHIQTNGTIFENAEITGYNFGVTFATTPELVLKSGEHLLNTGLKPEDMPTFLATENDIQALTEEILSEDLIRQDIQRDLLKNPGVNGGTNAKELKSVRQAISDLEQQKKTIIHEGERFLQANTVRASDGGVHYQRTNDTTVITLGRGRQGPGK